MRASDSVTSVAACGIWIELPRVAARVRQGDIREGRAERDVIAIDAVAQRRLDAEQNADRRLFGDVDDVIGQTAAVREALDVAGQHAEPVGTRRRQYVGVQPDHLARL